MKNILIIPFLLAAIVAIAQPVSRVRIAMLQAPADTNAVNIIVAGAGQDSVRYIELTPDMADTLLMAITPNADVILLPGSWAGGGGSGDNFATANLTFTGNRTHNLADFDLDIQESGGESMLFFDESAMRLAIGTTLPSVTFHINRTDGIRIPYGTTAQRVTATGNPAVLRLNSTLNRPEIVTSNSWFQLDMIGDDRALGDNTNGTWTATDKGAIVQISDATNNSTFVTFSLPGTPADGDDVFCECKSGSIIDANDGCRILGNGNNINGSSTYTFTASNTVVYLRYSSTIGEWKLLGLGGSGAGGGSSTLSYASFSGNSPNFSISTTQANFTSTSFSLGLESGADWAYDATNDEMDYTGTTGIFLINYVATGSIGAGTLKDISMVAEKNNATITGSLSVQTVSATDDEGVTFAGTCFVSLSNGDSINLAMFTTSTTAEFDCDNASMTVFMLPGQ